MEYEDAMSAALTVCDVARDSQDAADLLGVSRRTMHYKIKKFGIDTAKRSA